jgi:hypothetical protein
VLGSVIELVRVAPHGDEDLSGQEELPPFASRDLHEHSLLDQVVDRGTGRWRRDVQPFCDATGGHVRVDE